MTDKITKHLEKTEQVMDDFFDYDSRLIKWYPN